MCNSARRNKDEAFLTQANEFKRDIDPLNGEEVEELVNDLFKTPPAVVKKLKKLLLP